MLMGEEGGCALIRVCQLHDVRTNELTIGGETVVGNQKTDRDWR